MKQIRFILLVALVLVVSGITGFVASQATQTMGVRIHAKDLPEYGLVIIKPSDPSFNAEASALLKNATREDLESIKPLSVVIKNIGDKTVVAHTIIWEAYGGSGERQAYRISYANSEFFIDRNEYVGSLAGTDADKTIKAGSALLVSLVALPSGNGPSGGGGGSRQNRHESQQRQDIDVNDSQQSLEGLRSEVLTKYSDITILIDGVFFDDGTFVGPDSFGFFDRMRVQVDAKRDLINSIADSVEQKKSEDEIFQEIQAKANMEVKKPTDKVSLTDYYHFFTRLFAEEILLKRKQYGENTLEIVLRPRSQHQTVLRRL